MNGDYLTRVKTLACEWGLMWGHDAKPLHGRTSYLVSMNALSIIFAFGATPVI